MGIIRNPVFKEGLAVLKNQQNLHKLPGIFIIFLLILIFFTGPKGIIKYATTPAVPLFHLFTWYGIIIGFIGINLYWAGERTVLQKYSPIRKWFAYTALTPLQFFTGKMLLSCLEIFILIVMISPFIITTMVMSGFLFQHIIPVFLIILINAFTCRIVSVYFHSTFKEKKFPFSLPFLIMYFWLILLYIGTFFLFPYANVFSVLLTLEPTLEILFESLLKTSVIHIPWFDYLASGALHSVPTWLVSFCIYFVLLIVFIIFFYIKVFFIKKGIPCITRGENRDEYQNESGNESGK